MKAEWLANDETAQAPGDADPPAHCCQVCGLDLTGYVHPQKQWMRTGPLACDECPGCGKNPRWHAEEHTNDARFETATCTTCKERYVFRAHYASVRERRGDGVVRTRVSKRTEYEVCDACREAVQARIHARRAADARERSENKRASQRRGLARFLAAEAKKARKGAS